MEIRKAIATDEQQVCRLWEMLLKFYNKQASLEVLQRSYRYAIDHPQKILIFIIIIEGVVTGTASLHLGRYSTWDDKFYGHIEDVIIDPHYRGQGLVGQLLRHVISAAEEQKLCRLELIALNDNHAARKTYEKAGFTTDSVSYELILN